MRSRGQSPLLPYTNSQRLPSKTKLGRTSTATRVFIFTAALVCVLYGAYAFFEPGGSSKSQSSGSGGSSGRGLAAHEEVAQLQGRNAPVLEDSSGQEVQQLQTQGAGHEKAPELQNNGLTADEAARATDSVGSVRQHSNPPTGLYGMEANDIDGFAVDLSKFAGRVSLVVNVASECGYTDSNYRGLQQLYDKYKDAGFEVLAFPCNSFGKQEPGSEQAIKDFAKVRYGVTFPLFQRVEVLGADAHPIFKFLSDSLPAAEGVKDLWQPKWNFSKWLVSKQGFPVKHYDSAFNADQLERDIADEIAKPVLANGIV